MDQNKLIQREVKRRMIMQKNAFNNAIKAIKALFPEAILSYKEYRKQREDESEMAFGAMYILWQNKEAKKAGKKEDNIWRNVAVNFAPTPMPTMPNDLVVQEMKTDCLVRILNTALFKY